MSQQGLLSSSLSPLPSTAPTAMTSPSTDSSPSSTTSASIPSSSHSHPTQPPTYYRGKDPPTAPAASQHESHARIRGEARKCEHESPEEVSRRIQKIHSQAYDNRIRRDEEELKEERRSQKRCKSYYQPSMYGESLLGCAHYARNCKVQAECCGAYVSCRFCHDEHMKCHHEMKRSDIKRVLCMHCDTEQDAGRCCINCGKEFAKYFCSICKLYDNTPGKDIYHCDKCGHCRIGKGIGIDNVHCDNCEACIVKSDFASHCCRSRSTHADCSICGEYLHTSRSTCRLTNCGHAIHQNCLEEYANNGQYTCPICQKSLFDMTEHFRRLDRHLATEQRMPEEYQDKLSHIYCYDCEEKTIAPYHFVYHKCGNKKCGSYNTNILKMLTKE